MLPDAILRTIALGLCASLVLLGSVWVVSLTNLLRAALSLGLVLIGVALAFLMLEAEFLAFVQILVYVGAILTLVVFAIMLTARLHDGPIAAPNRQQGPAAAASVLLFVVLASVTQGVAWPEGGSGGPVRLAELGERLVTTLVLPFEVISLVFVAAVVGAIVLAARPKAKA